MTASEVQRITFYGPILPPVVLRHQGCRCRLLKEKGIKSPNYYIITRFQIIFFWGKKCVKTDTS